MPRLTTLLAVALGYGLSGQPAVSARRYQRPDRTLAFGEHPLQTLDFYSAGEGIRPLVVFVHGGAWQFGDKARRLADRKAPFCRSEGWHFASLNFRLVPEVGVAEMAADVAAGLRTLWDASETLGVDRGRIVLIGHSSGAHLAALVATDPSYPKAVGLSPGDLAGVIANDGAAYDARESSVRSGWLDRRLIRPALPPDDPALLAQLSASRRGIAQRTRVPDPSRRARCGRSPG